MCMAEETLTKNIRQLCKLLIQMISPQPLPTSFLKLSSRLQVTIFLFCVSNSATECLGFFSSAQIRPGIKLSKKQMKTRTVSRNYRLQTKGATRATRNSQESDSTPKFRRSRYRYYMRRRRARRFGKNTSVMANRRNKLRVHSLRH